VASHRSPAFRGRSRERDLLDEVLEDVRGGQSAALVIRGEAGMGKSALCRYCGRQASGFRVARATGVETEMELPFAGLHQLCAPMLGRLDALPEPQQVALRVAFGLASGDVPERFLVALAVLSPLAEVAAERPLLCFIEDHRGDDRRRPGDRYAVRALGQRGRHERPRSLRGGAHWGHAPGLGLGGA
jgi:AAA ATPase domain